MSTPDPYRTPQHGMPVNPRVRPEQRVTRSGQRPGLTRTTRAAIWTKHHLGELGSVTAPSVLAVIVSPWWAIGSCAAAGVWAALECRAKRLYGRKETEQ